MSEELKFAEKIAEAIGKKFPKRKFAVREVDAKPLKYIEITLYPEAAGPEVGVTVAYSMDFFRPETQEEASQRAQTIYGVFKTIAVKG